MPLIQQSGSVAIGTPIGSGSSGSVLFIDSTGKLAQDNTNFLFDDGTNSLTVGGNLLFTTNDVSTIGVTGTRPNKIWVGTGGIDSQGNLVVRSGASAATHDFTSTTYRISGAAGIQLNASGSLQFYSASHRLYDTSGNTGLVGTPSASFYVWNTTACGNLIEQRNGTNAQTFNLYDSYTDASNYARFSMMFSGGYAYIKSQKLGTGVNSGMYLDSAGQLYYNAGTSASSHTWYIATTGYMTLVNLSGTYALKPVTDGGTDLGGSAFRWNKGWFGTGGIESTGTLVVNGTTTYGQNSISCGSTAFQINNSNAADLLIRNSTGAAVLWGKTTAQVLGGSIRFYEETGTNYLPLSVSSTTAVLGSGGSYGNTIEQRNGANAQTFRVYNTYTDASNYERAYFQWSGNIFYVGTQAFGTGTVRNLLIGSGSDTIQLNGVSHYFRPSPDNTIESGTTTNRWSKGWFGTGGIDLTGSIIFNAKGTLSSPGADILRWTNNAATGIFSLQVNVNVSQFTGTSNLWTFQNSTSAQTLRLQRTYTDASNQAYLESVWSGNNCLIRTVGVGTGTVGNLILSAAGGVAELTLSSSVNNITSNASLVPAVTLSRSVGSPSLRWIGIYGQLVDLAPADNTVAVTVAGSTLTAANAQSLVSLSQTWNTTGSPTGFLVNYTNTASGASTNLFDWQLGGVSQFKLHKSTGLSLFQGGQTLTLASNLINSDNGSFTYGTNNCKLVFASNQLLQRNGTSANTYQLFRTYTDGSNNAYLEQTWSGNNALIRTVGNGTGTIGELHLYGGSSGFSLQINASGIRFDDSAIVYWGTRSRFASAGGGILNVTNAAATGFTRFTLGPESVNFPSLKVNSGYGIDLRNGNDSAFYSLNLLTAGLQGVTYANRPATPARGMIVCITDSNTATWGATIAGGGANNVIAFWNGANWTVMGA